MTKKDIELPPLPVGTTSPMVHGAYYCASDMHDYARAAIESDRQRRGEQRLKSAGVFKNAEGLRRLAEADGFWENQPYGKRLYFGDGGLDYLHRDVLRAAVHALASPQPAEPAKDDSDALTVAYMSGFYDGKKAAPKFGEEE